MLERSRALAEFVGLITRLNRGRAFYATPERLGEYVLVDFVTAARSGSREQPDRSCPESEYDPAMTKQTGYLETNGARIYYEVEGSGEPVLLVHAGVADLTMWDGQLEACGDHRVIRYDTRGFGRTQTEAVPFSNRADIAALLGHVGEASAHVVGLSRGAMHRPRLRPWSFRIAFGRSRWRPAGSAATNRRRKRRPRPGRNPSATSTRRTGTRSPSGRRPTGRTGRASLRIARQMSGRRCMTGCWRNYRAEKVEGQPQPLQPPAIERLEDLRGPLLVLAGTLDDPGTTRIDAAPQPGRARRSPRGARDRAHDQPRAT